MRRTAPASARPGGLRARAWCAGARARRLLAVAAVGAAVAGAPGTAGAAVLSGFGAAPAAGDGPVGAGDRVTFTIRAMGESPSAYVVSVNGEEVAKGSAGEGVTEGDFRMPEVGGTRDAVTVGVVLDDADSEPRTVSLAYARPREAPAADPGPASPPAADAPSAAGGPLPAAAASPEPAPARPAERPATGGQAGPGGGAERPSSPSAQGPERPRTAPRDRPAQPGRAADRGEAARRPVEERRRGRRRARDEARREERGRRGERDADRSERDEDVAAPPSGTTVSPGGTAAPERGASPAPGEDERGSAEDAASPPPGDEAGLAPGNDAATADGWSATPILAALAIVAAAIAAVGALRLGSRARRPPPHPIAVGARRPAPRSPAQNGTARTRPERSPRLLDDADAAGAEREPAAPRR